MKYMLLMHSNKQGWDEMPTVWSQEDLEVMVKCMHELNQELKDSGESVSADVMSYINRLSDFLFVASRYLNDKGARDVLWIPGANR